jgi:tRNA ligase
VREFLEDVGRHGEYEGRAVEGFVVRCRLSDKPGVEPYHDWFFKYKFEEPYLMYRQWRECTKALIAGKTPKIRKHVRITEEYLAYTKKYLAANPRRADEYNKNHGIIALRDAFLAAKGLGGVAAANLEDDQGSGDVEAHPEIVGNVFLVPIATIGCGKTTLAVALAHLFGWGHVQNDNITGKARPPRFMQACYDVLDGGAPVVLADRNNSGSLERKQLINDVRLGREGAKIVALNWLHDSIDDVRRITRERVSARGNNHQTIHMASDSSKYITIMEGFLRRFEPFDATRRPDNGFDACIDLDPTADSRQNLEAVVERLHKMYPGIVAEMPTAEQLDEAVEVALGYRPDPRHVIAAQPDSRGKKDKDQRNQQPAKPPRKQVLEYVGVTLPRAGIVGALEGLFKGKAPDEARFWTQLNKMGRVQPAFHVTLMHRAGETQNRELWERYKTQHQEALAAEGGDSRMGEMEVQLERVSLFFRGGGGAC